MKKRTTRNHYTPEQKAQIVLEVLNEDQTIGQIAGAYDIHVNMLRKWKAQAVERLPSLFSDEHQAVRELEAAHERERQELYAEIGRLTTQLAWLKKKSGFNLVEK
jgi:transposase-like protein